MVSGDLLFEFKRKFFHLMGIIPLLLFSFFSFNYSKNIGLFFLFFCLLFSLIFDYFRVEFKKIHFINSRKKEEEIFHAATFFFLAAIIVLSLFDQTIALASLYAVIFGDFSSAVFGKSLGKKKIFREKSYVGCIAGFLTCILIGLFFFDSYLFILLLGIGYFIVDLFTQKLDDNLTAPIFICFLIYLASLI